MSNQTPNSTNTTPVIIAISSIVIILIISVTAVIVTNNNNNYSDFDQMMMGDSSKNKSNSSDDDSMMGMNHSMSMATITSDKDFLENMIPHHQEAVDSSQQVIDSTDDSELKTFAQMVIDAQTKEISEMKSLYKTWFNEDYSYNSSYMPMMTGMNGKTGTALDKEYVRGMIEHHQGAIAMAQQIQTITQRDEIKNLSSNIISSQASEVDILKGWLMSKYGDHSMMGM